MCETNRSELMNLFELSKGNENTLTIEATVDTGLEWIAVGECKEKIASDLRCIKGAGKIYFNVLLSDLPKVIELRSVDNIYIVAGVFHIEFDKENNVKNFDLLKNISCISNELNKCLKIWKTIVKFPGIVLPTREEYENAVESYKEVKSLQKQKQDNISKGKKKRGCDPSTAQKDSVLSFRVTCERSGTHSFQSNQAGYEIGCEFQNNYNWIVDLTSYQLEVLCRIHQDEVLLNLRITHQSLHRRNIVHFGLTTLRATICYNLLRLAEPKVGDIIIDPMCGGGSIPIEAAIILPNNYVLGGDKCISAVKRSQLNFNELPKKYKSDLLRWSVTQLPFKDSYIDIFITDMPFGKRMSSKQDNRVQYKYYLLELARVLQLKFGRLVLLTYDRRSISIALQTVKGLFHVKKTLRVNMGGLNAVTYVLHRTNLTFEEFKTTSKIFNPRKATQKPKECITIRT